MGVLGICRMVRPSGAARLTYSTAMRPPAPTLLSTSTLGAYLPRSFSASGRATKSPMPPAGKPEMMKALPADWARAGRPRDEARALATLRCKRERRFMVMVLSPKVPVLSVWSRR